MGRGVDESYMDINYWITEQWTTCERVEHTLLDRRQLTARNTKGVELLTREF